MTSLFDPHALLAEEAVVLDHGPDALFGRVTGDRAATIRQAGQGGCEALGTDMIGRPAAGGVVAHAGNAEDLGDVDLALHPFDLGLQVAAGASEEVRADGVVDDLDADAIGFVRNSAAKSGSVLPSGTAMVENSMTSKPISFALAMTAICSIWPGCDQATETVRTDSDFHALEPVVRNG